MRKFNLSLDDLSPHPRAGLGFESIGWCDKLIEKYPFICINLFVPSSYCRLGEEQGQYDIIRNKSWVDRLDGFSKLNYRVNFHGVCHSRQYYPSNQKQYEKYAKSNNDEWEYLTYNDSVYLINTMLTNFKVMGLSHIKTFRPPGWKISKDAAQALTDAGFKIAGDTKYYNLLKDKVKNLQWVSYNWDMTKPCNVKGDIVAYGHTSDWCNNYMDETRYKLIDEILSKEEFDFKFIEEM